LTITKSLHQALPLPHRDLEDLDLTVIMVLTEEALVALLQVRPEDGRDLALMGLPHQAPVMTLVAGVVLIFVALLPRLALPKALVAGKALALMIVLPRQAPVMTLVAGKVLALVALLQAHPEDGKTLALVALLHLALMMALPHPVPVEAQVVGVVLTLVVPLHLALVKVMVVGEALVPMASLMVDR
jgi:hypothetical protein